MSPITLADIRAQLHIPSRFHAGTGLHALPLLDAIEQAASTTPAIRTALDQWLAKGSTVLLRDTLCAPFAHAPFVQAQQGPIREGKRPYAFDDMWTALDTAYLHCAVRTGLRAPYADDIPTELGTATLIHDPFRAMKPWLTLLLSNGQILRERYKTRAEAYHDMARMDIALIEA